MVYSTELASKVAITSNDSKYLEAGIHDNVKFTGVRAATSPTGKNFMEFRFEKDGKELLYTEWEPNEREGDSAEQSHRSGEASGGTGGQAEDPKTRLRCCSPREGGSSGEETCQ